MTELLDDGTSPNISSEEQETVRTVIRLFEKHKKYRSKYDRNWLHYYRMFRGDQWDGVKMPRHRQREVINMIWQTVQSSHSQQMDVRPRISFTAKEPSDQPFTEVLNDLVNADWDRQNWLVPLSEIVLDGYIYGIGLGSVGYDDDADYGMGSSTFQSEDPFYIYPDPNCSEVNGRYSEAFIKAEPLDTSLVRRMYPDRADHIKADVRDVLKSSKASINEFTYRATNTDLDMPDLTVLRGSETSEDKTMVITAYLKPHDTEELEEVIKSDENGEPLEIRTTTKKVYPFGRVIKVACGVVLEDTPHLPFQNGQFPFVKYVNYLLPREFYGVSEVEQLESPQRVFNKLINASLEIMGLMGNPVWVIDTASGINPRSLVNRTGLVVQKEPGSEVRREAGVQLSGSALSLIDRMETWFNNIAGSQDVARGQTPGSVTAASAIEALQEAARTRIKQKQRNLDAMVRNWGQLYADIVLEKYNKPRVFRVTNDQGSTKYFRFNTEKVVVDGREMVKAVVRDYEDRDGVIIPAGEVKESLIADRFDVTVNTVSGLPFQQARKEERALTLFDRQIIDEQEVLDAVDYPNREAVLQRLEQRKQAEAEAAAAQQGA